MHHPAVTSRWLMVLLTLLFAVAGVTLALRFVAPIADSDPFWHMAYARQMLERGTLVLDHSAFSWTPASTATVYCAWIAEFALLGAWKLAGLAGLMAVPFLAAVIIVGLLWQFARREGVAASPFTVFVLLLVMLASSGVITAKPEVFSVVFTHVTLWLYFEIRRADREEGHPLRFVVALPVLVLIWVNSHGGFILATPLFAAFVVGELINARAAPKLALSPTTRRALVAACIACVLVTVITPYGLEYPRQLLTDYVWHRGARPDVAWNSAHRSLLDVTAGDNHLVQALTLMLGTLTVLWWHRFLTRRMRVDAVLLLLVLGTLPLYLLYLRTTYMFVAVFGYVAVYLATPVTRSTTSPTSPTSPTLPTLTTVARSRASRQTFKVWLAQGACSLLVVAMSAQSISDARYRPGDRHGWFGFGISTINPVEENAYLERAGFRGNLYNTFETGGYLLWMRHPDIEVMVDARSFPYLSWFDDHFQFASGESFDAFLNKYPGADVALVDYAKGPLLRNFVRSNQWHMVFAGQSAVIFARHGSAAARVLPAQRSAALQQLRNASGALAIFDFMRFAGDERMADDVARQLQTSLAWQLRDADMLHQAEAAADYVRGLDAARVGQYLQAFNLLNGALNRKVISTREEATLVVLHALADRYTVLSEDQRGVLQTQLSTLVAGVVR